MNPPYTAWAQLKRVRRERRGGAGVYRRVPEDELTEREVTADQVTEHEVAVHVFVPLDGAHAEEGVASVRAMWGRFRELQRGERELYASLPVDMPDVLSGPAAHGSVVVAGVQSADRLDQAIVRRHRQILNLSVLLGAGPDREWSGLRERVETIIGPLGACHLGAVTLELGKAPAQTPGDADVLEPERGDEDDARRVLRLLGRTGADGQLGAWAWSDGGGHPEMPHFVRHLMHMTAIRHQHRTYRWLMQARATGTTKPLARMRTPDGGEDRELPSTAEIHYIRDSVDGSWHNARQALESSGLDGGSVAAADRRFTSSFLGWLNDILAHLRMAGIGDPLPSPRRGPDQRVRVLVVADEWFPARGGLSTFNSKLCAALARQDADVRVMVEAATPDERADAAEYGVRLIDVAQPGLSTDAALSVPPVFDDGFVPDVVIGHGRVTGPCGQGAGRAVLQERRAAALPARRTRPGRGPQAARRRGLGGARRGPYGSGAAALPGRPAPDAGRPPAGASPVAASADARVPGSGRARTRRPRFRRRDTGDPAPAGGDSADPAAG